MKKILAIILALILMLSTVSFFAFGQGSEDSRFDFNLKTADIRIRDPAVMVYDGLYYMYGTDACTAPRLRLLCE